jgi:hypothetical protein
LLEPVGLLGKQVAHVRALDNAEMLMESVPGGVLFDRSARFFRGCLHA